jgi:hypothetical protein
MMMVMAISRCAFVILSLLASATYVGAQEGVLGKTESVPATMITNDHGSSDVDMWHSDILGNGVRALEEDASAANRADMRSVTGQSESVPATMITHDHDGREVDNWHSDILGNGVRPFVKSDP